MKKLGSIGNDVNYIGRIGTFNCKECGSPLLMDGCDNKDCNNYYVKNIRKESEKCEIKSNYRRHR